MEFAGKILAELGDDFYVARGTCWKPYDVNLSLIPSYNIRRKGIFGARFWLLNSRTVLKLFDRGHYGISTEPENLSHYSLIREEFVPENVKEMLRKSQLLEWDSKREIYRTLPVNSLEKINLSDITGTLEKGIENLVRALRSLNLATLDSCEGHLDRRRKPYPWVSIWNVQKHRELYQMIEAYNKTSPIKWGIPYIDTIPGRPGDLIPLQTASNEGELKVLQENAENLARFLFDNYAFKYTL